MVNLDEIYKKVSANFWNSAQIARWIETHFFRKSVYRQTSGGSQHANLPIITDANGKIDTSFLTGTALAEYIADTVGAMFSGNTETRVTVTYQDSDNTIDVVVDAFPTTEEIQDIVGAMATDSSSIDFSYNDAAGTFTASVITEAIEDIVGGMVPVGGDPLFFMGYDDVNGEFTFTPNNFSDYNHTHEDSFGGGRLALAALADMATDSLIGRDTAGSGAPETISLNATLSMTGSGALQRAALTGDVTASAGSNATTIANDAVTNAKMANMAQDTIKGRASGAGTGDPTDLTATQVRTIINVENGADVTDADNVEAAITSAWSSTAPVDTDYIIVLNAAQTQFKEMTFTGLKSYLHIEAGTWTPVYADAVSGGNTASIATNNGYYVRIGNLVWVTGRSVDITTTGMTGANALAIRGLPFTSSNQTNFVAIGMAQVSNVTFSGYVIATIGANTAVARLTEHTSGGAAANLTVSDLTSGTADVFFSLVYEVD